MRNMGAVKSNQCQFSYKLATIFVGFFSILVLIITFSIFEAFKKEMEVDKGDLYCLIGILSLDAVLSILLLCGAFLEKHWLLLPWLVIMVLKLGSAIVMEIIMMGKTIEDTKYKLLNLNLNIPTVSATSVVIVCWITVMKYFDELRIKQHVKVRESPSMKNDPPSQLV